MTDTKVKLVLASASPRRLALLEQAGVVPDLLNPVDIDETPKKRETPRSLSARLALEKARTAAAAPLVHALGPLRFIVAADTVVAVGKRIIGKPQSIDEAAKALWLQSGRSHRVYSTVAVVAPSGGVRSSPTNGAARRAPMRSRAVPRYSSARSMARIRG